MITRDARIKERKKYGLKKARRAPQFSKRQFQKSVYTGFFACQNIKIVWAILKKLLDYNDNYVVYLECIDSKS